MLNKFNHKGLYAITDKEITGLSHIEIVSEILEGGGKLIQLREKSLLTGDFYQTALQAVTLARRKGASLIINDRVDIALMVEADGVHLGQDDLDPEKARSLLGQDAIIGLSTHSLAQAILADKRPIDYIAVGPIFPTLTKPEASAEEGGYIGLELLFKVCQLVSKPVVAIGGITLNTAKDVLETGASAVAVISDLLKYDSIRQRTNKFLIELEPFTKI